MVKLKEILTGTFPNKVKYVRSTSRSTSIRWLFQLSLIFSSSFWITGKKADLKHCTCKRSVLLYTSLRTSPLKNCIHESAHERRNWNQNASILWLAIDLPNKNSNISQIILVVPSEKSLRTCFKNVLFLTISYNFAWNAFHNYQLIKRS